MPAKGKGRAKAAANHQLAAVVPKGTEVKDLRKKSWFIGESIGSGGFGLIYLAGDSKDKISKEKAQHVIKVEPHSNGPIFCEIAFYQRAAKEETINAWRKSTKLPYVGIPAYVAHGLHSGSKEELRFLVMPRYGSDLQNVWMKENKRFGRALVCQLAVQLINALEYMHANEYVHADVKGSNILIGYKDPSQIFLVDFGLAYRYTVDGKHKEYHEDPKKAHDGTIEYTSRDAHRGVAPSRRSDLEILGYVLLHWISGQLPWENKLTDKNYVKDRKIEHMKNVKKFVASVCTEEKSHVIEIEKFIQSVAKLEYKEEPDYRKLRKYFQDTLKTMGVSAKSKINFESEEMPIAQTSRKRRSHSSVEKNLQSDESGSSKRARRTPTRPKKVNSTSADCSGPTSEELDITPGHQSSRNKKAQPKTKSVKKTTKPKSQLGISEDTSTDENYTPSARSKGKRAGKFIDLVSEDSSADEKFEPAVKSPAQRAKRVANHVRNYRECDESSAVEYPTDCKSEVEGTTRKSPIKPMKQVTNSRMRSRYSMAPLHTESVLGKDDVLTGEYSGKHPVIRRRRKVRRPMTDAVTQTTPSLKKRASHV